MAPSSRCKGRRISGLLMPKACSTGAGILEPLLASMSTGMTAATCRSPNYRPSPLGDPWLSAGLLKDGDPIYQVKWETEWPLPKLLHIQRIEDVEIFGIWTANYGNYVIDKAAWEQRYGIDAASLERQPLASAVPPGVTLTINRAPSTPAPPPAPAPAPAPAAPVAATPTDDGEWIYNTRQDELTGAVADNLALFSDDYGMLLMLRCNTNTIMEGFVGVTEESEPLPGGPEKRIRAYYRFDDGAIVDGWWGSSVRKNSAFIPIDDLPSFIEGLAESTRLVVRLVNHDGVEYTGVFNTIGAPGQATKLVRRCTA